MTSRRRSWLLAILALAAGLALWGWDDLFMDLATDHPAIHRLLSMLEMIVLGPCMALMAFAVSEYLRLAELALAGERQHARQQRLVALGRVAAGLAHEVRNPLHNIRLLIEETRQVDGVADRDALLRRVDANVQRIDRAVELVYRLARPASTSTGEAVCDLAAAVVEAVEAENRRCGGRAQVTLADPPTASAACQVEDLRMALDNLLRNATAAAATATVAIVRVDRAWEVVVRNRGELPAAIVAVGRGEGFDSDKPGGLGLGLAIARQLIEESGGTLTIAQSGPDVEARIRLPEAA